MGAAAVASPSPRSSEGASPGRSGAIDEFVCENADYLDWDAFSHALAEHVHSRNRPAERERRETEAAMRRRPHHD